MNIKSVFFVLFLIIGSVFADEVSCRKHLLTCSPGNSISLPEDNDNELNHSQSFKTWQISNRSVSPSGVTYICKRAILPFFPVIEEERHYELQHKHEETHGCRVYCNSSTSIRYLTTFGKIVMGGAFLSAGSLLLFYNLRHSGH